MQDAGKRITEKLLLPRATTRTSLSRREILPERFSFCPILKYDRRRRTLYANPPKAIIKISEKRITFGVTSFPYEIEVVEYNHTGIICSLTTTAFPPIVTRVIVPRFA